MHGTVGHSFLCPVCAVVVLLLCVRGAAVLTLTLARRSSAMVVGESLVGDAEADRLRGLAPDDDDGDDLSAGVGSDSEED